MRVGIIGLGDIAKKAYLPILGARAGIELKIATRNVAALHDIGERYRIPARYSSVDALLEAGIDVAFVHVATDAHVPVVKALLQAGVHVYLDKPIANTYEEALLLVEMAEQHGCLLRIGFNRRYAPMYRQVKTNETPDLIVMQKNRTSLAGSPRTVIFDDFIHVIDTLRWLGRSAYDTLDVRWKMKGNELAYVVAQLSVNEHTAIGIMSRESGLNEETLEVMRPFEKWIVRDLAELVHWRGTATVTKRSDWQNAYEARGFGAMVEDFFAAVSRGGDDLTRDMLETHRVCEEIIRVIEAK